MKGGFTLQQVKEVLYFKKRESLGNKSVESMEIRGIERIRDGLQIIHES